MNTTLLRYTVCTLGLVCALLYAPQKVNAAKDRVVLKDGKVVMGSIISDKNGILQIRVESGLINLPRTRISSIDKLSESEEIDVAISYLERQVTTGRAVDTTIQLETLLNRPGISKSQRDRLIKLKQVVQLRLEHQANKDLQSVHARVQHLLDRNDFLGAEKLIRSAIQSGMRAPELYDCYFRFWDNCAINPLEKLQFLAETASAGTEERRKKIRNAIIANIDKYILDKNNQMLL